MSHFDLFIHELSELFEEYSVNQGFYTENDRYFIADRVFWYNHMPFVIIERKKVTRLNDINLTQTTYYLSNYQDYLDVAWFIFWVNDGERIFLRSIKDNKFTEFDDYNEVIKIIASSEGLQKKAQLDPFNSKEYVNHIKDLIRGSLKDLKRSKEVKAFLDLLKSDDIETVNNIVYFKNQIEIEFFLSLLTQVENDSIYWRYTSSHSLYLLLKHSSQNLLSINCMNDKSEIDYADKYLNHIINKDKKIITTSNVQEANQVFILSCCDDSKFDDLLMWRLYGQDAEGISIGYALNNDNIDFDKFFIAKVSYANDATHHKELELIGKMIAGRFQNRFFRFRKWAIWKHFFKPYDYNYENEVRLIYFDKENLSNSHTEWIEDSKNGIISPMKVFLLNEEFPLILKGVITGPKAHESEINRLQYKAMLDESNIFMKDSDDFYLSESTINIYR